MGIRFNKKKDPFSTQYPRSLFSRRKKDFLCWFLLGCLLSLVIHFIIIKKIRTFEVPTFNPASFDKFIPRKFSLERVEIDPKSLQESKNKTEIFLTPVEVPIVEKVNTNSKEAAPQDVLKPESATINQLEKVETLSEKDTLLPTSQKTNQPLISLDKEGLEEKNSLESITTPSSENTKGYSQLDDLIKEKEPLSSQTAPILLPTDLLFEYNADQLKAEAEKSLEKLALLIQRNPKAFFIIEGFTDSFGTAEYNLDLSTRRANSIKEWLIKKQAIDEHQIEAYGLGKTHFIVPSTGTIQQQQLNRRVEIVIRKM